MLHGRGHKSVVFVLDEFDLFAKPVKQTVLYNLLDALQASNIQVWPSNQISPCNRQCLKMTSRTNSRHVKLRGTILPRNAWAGAFIKKAVSLPGLTISLQHDMRCRNL